MLEYKFPIEYELEPRSFDKGIHWLTLRIKNMGAETLTRLDVRLHSTDTLYLSVYGEGHYIAELKPNEVEEAISRISINGSTPIYATISARKNGEHFWWESPRIYINIIEQTAELESLFVLSNPHTSVGKTLRVEATIKGLKKSVGLNLEFWAHTPSEKFEELAKIKVKELFAGEEAKYSTEFTTNETGIYSLQAYLYDEWQRIGYKTDTIYVS